MIARFFRKSVNAIKNYGIREFARRMYVFFDRKFRPTKYFHFDFSETSKRNDGMEKPKEESKEYLSAKKLLIITGEPRNATSYYRCDIPKMQLAKFNWATDIIHEKYALDLKVKIDNYNAVIFYRTPWNDLNCKLFGLAKEQKIPTIFSVDDFVYRRDLLEQLDYVSYLDKDDASRFLERAEGMLKLLKQCDYGIASTDYLAKDMSKYIKEGVFVARNGYLKDYSDLVVTSGRSHKEKDKIILGYYSGSETHDRDLNLIWPSLKKVLEKFDNVVLQVGGRINFDFGQYNSKVKRLPFVPMDEFMKILAETDINLFPLEDTEFNRGKSEIKFTGAALVHVPTIASAVGDMRSIIKPEIGILASSEKDWYDGLARLIQDASFRNKLGKNAREFVLENYDLDYLGAGLNGFLRSVLEKF